MTRFLVDDLTKAVEILELEKRNEYMYSIRQFQDTIDHAKQVLIDVEEERDFSQQDRTLSNGKIKTATGFVEEPTCTDIRDMDGFGREGF